MSETDDRTITIDEARELVSDRKLWPLVREFLWDFAAQIHPSWIEDVISGGDAALRENKSPRVNAWILELLGVQPCFHTFPKDDWSRLLLLDGATLESLVKWLGALACADELRHVTSGATVRELKAALPGVYPEVFSYTAYFPMLSRGGAAGADSQRGESFAASIPVVGYGMLASLTAGIPAPVVSRLRFKLPKSLGASASSVSLRDTNASAAIKLLKLRFPEAYSLCCS